MKTQTSSMWLLGLVLLAVWLPNGLAQNNPENSSTNAQGAVFVPSTISEPEIPPPPTNSPLRVRLSPWAMEIVRLARAGIDGDVMLSFIDNAGMFNLGADQIIYLSDLGISSEVIGKMLHHDADVIAGARPLTISSDLPQDDSVRITFVPANTQAQTQALQPTAPPASVTESVQLAAASAQPSVELVSDVGSTNYLSHDFTLDNGEAAEMSVEQTEVEDSSVKTSYPVREPYPVPITAPILVVQGYERAPNTIIIEMFPKHRR